jgi:AraC-like DNA-binding protein
MIDKSASPKMMFLTKDRYFYRGLLGAWMNPRTLGAFSIYIAPTTHFKIKCGTGEWETRTIATVAPNMRHQIISECGTIISVGVEPERIQADDFHEIQKNIDVASAGTDHFVKKLNASMGAFTNSGQSSDLSTDKFDQLVFGRALCPKKIDPRIETVLSMFQGDLSESNLAAQECAEAIHLSTSRFLHLFKESTGISFRSFRTWKRARQFLAYANHNSSLTTVALDLGYPDSSHFSHSIRKIYGLKPRSIRDGSKDLKVFAGSGHIAPDQIQVA